uniref:Small ribosomal subunit protein uS4c n=1 Tax=Prasinococcus sp. CCMP1194 TaxID=110672 RepID=A0A088CJU2_9VIRI|nr:ribosomal protein S4 [Prasinococcus sp. CCMP1194]
MKYTFNIYLFFFFFMVRTIEPKLKRIRRLGDIPGLTEKVSIRSAFLDPQTGKPKKLSEYGYRLKEKQKLRFYYGVTEKQLIRYMKKAKASKNPTGKALIQFLEMRLDNIIFRAGVTSTVSQARQLVNHGHVKVNNQRVNIPSFQCRIDDSISFRHFEKTDLPIARSFPPCNHLEVDFKKSVIKVTKKADISSLPFQLNEMRVIEYYSRKI